MRNESAGGIADLAFFTFDSFYFLDCDVAVAFLSLALYHSMVGADDEMRSSDLFFYGRGTGAAAGKQEAAAERTIWIRAIASDRLYIYRLIHCICSLHDINAQTFKDTFVGMSEAL